jgi:ABC-type multidrug transport system fused ATPase/permease subunit
MNRWKFVFDTIKEHKWRVAIFFIYIVVNDIFAIFIVPYILKLFGDYYQLKTLTTSLAIFLAFLYAFCFSFREFTTFLLLPNVGDWGVYKIAENVTKKIFSYTIQHSPSYFDDKMSGVILQKISDINYNIGYLIHGLFNSVITVMMVIFSCCVYFKINASSGIFFIWWFFAFIIFQKISSNLTSKALKKDTEEREKISGLAVDSLTNIQNVKSFAMERKELMEVKKQGIRAIQSNSAVMWSQSIMNFFLFILNYSLVAFILGSSYKMFVEKQITLGTFFFILQNLLLTSNLVRVLFYDIVYSFENITIVNEALKTLMSPIEIKDKENAKEIKVTDGRIIFKNMIFNYKNEEQK